MLLNSNTAAQESQPANHITIEIDQGDYNGRTEYSWDS
jgi:hypothetical protein